MQAQGRLDDTAQAFLPKIAVCSEGKGWDSGVRRNTGGSVVVIQGNVSICASPSPPAPLPEPARGRAGRGETSAASGGVRDSGSGGLRRQPANYLGTGKLQNPTLSAPLGASGEGGSPGEPGVQADSTI